MHRPWLLCWATWSLAALSGTLTWHAQAAEQILAASRDSLLEAVETSLLEQQLSIIDSAATSSFDLMYARDHEGMVVTITLRAMPLDPTRLKLMLLTDTPRRVEVEEALLNNVRGLLNLPQ